MLFRAVDFETTGMPDDETRHAVCEAGWADVEQMPDGSRIVCAPESRLCNPGRPVPPEARAVHHLSDAMLMNAPPSSSAFMELMDGPPDYFVAHNADFEQLFFAGGEVPWICTFKLAVRIWPDAPAHNLQTLRYYLDLDVVEDLVMPPHRAGPDAYLCAVLLDRILKEGAIPFDKFVLFSSRPALLPRCNLKQHRGKSWEEVPTDYLQWIVNKSECERDVKATARYHLKLRADAQKAAPAATSKPPVNDDAPF